MVTNNAINVATAATGTVLQGAGVGTAPTFSTATYPSTTTINQILYSSSANVVGGLATANSAILATNSSGVPSITTASGNWLNTSRTAFLAYLGSVVSNVTGAGTTFTLGTTTALTKVFDQATDLNTNGTFTAPVTGKYNLTSNIDYTGTAASTNGTIQLVTSNRTYDNTQYTKVAPTFYANIITALCDMDAADTCTTTILVAGEAGNTVDILGGSTLYTYFCGNLVC